MNDQNPYQAPDSNLTDGQSGQDVDLAITGIHSKPALAGWNWIKSAFGIFKQSPLIWILLVIIWFVINVVAQIIPIIGGLAVSLLYAVFIAGFMHGCVALERNEELEIGHLFAGFKQNVGPLIGLGACYLLVFVVIGIVVGGLMFGSLATLDSNDPAAVLEGMLSSSAVTIFLIAIAIFIPIMMAFWFAPMLIALGNVSIMNALKMSFMGCIKNILPFLVSGIVITVLGILASIPVFLGWLVLAPMLFIMFYTAYRDIYTS